MRDRDPTRVGAGPRALSRRHGVRMRPRAVDAAGSDVLFADGTRFTPSTVMWATGFGLDHSWIEVPIFDDGGRVRHGRGIAAAAGLSFLGLPWQHTRGPALLGWVGEDAEHLAQHVAAPRRSDDTPSGAPR